MGHRTTHDLALGSQLGEDPGDAGTFNLDKYGIIIPMVSGASAQTRLMEAPYKAGQRAKLLLDTDGGGDITVTVYPTSGTRYGYNQANATTIVFGTAGDWALFESIKVGSEFAWSLEAHEGTNAVETGGGTVTSLTVTTLKMAVAAVAATGSAIGNAAALSMGLNVVSAADNTKAVILPVAEAGAVVVVKSSTNAKTLPVFPQVNSAIDTTAANGAVTLGAAALGAGALFVASSATLWHHLPIDVT